MNFWYLIQYDNHIKMCNRDRSNYSKLLLLNTISISFICVSF